MLINPLIALFIPMCGCILSGLFGSYFGRRGSVLITSTSLLLAVLLAWFNYFNSLSGFQASISLFSWISFLINNKWFFTVDSLALVMFVVVLTVSSIVHIYSSKYMEQDPHIVRFFTYLSLFTIFMLFLVSGGNFIILFLGWEGVGICSYLLINFWYTRLQANKAALKAMVVNRVGDISFLIGACLVIVLTGTLNFPLVFMNTNFFDIDFSWLLTLAGCSFLFAAVGKSAQIGLHTWLPDAMEGPTPVSALIHAATMVTAGVFLLIRSSILFNQSNISLNLAIVFGSLTAIFAGTVGITQFDIKRVIAYSTCSQLGYMILICGGAVFSVGLFHLFNHAFFKAALFLGAGSIIHAASDEQDMRRYGLIGIISPFLSVLFLVASLSLMGLPFLSGFYSKDVILESIITNNSIFGLWAYWIGLAAAGFTTAYSFKIAYWTFYYNTGYEFKYYIQNWHNVSSLEMVVLLILAILGIWSGYIFKDPFTGFGGNYFQSSIGISNSVVSGEFLPIWIKLIPLFSIIIFVSISYVISRSVMFGLNSGMTSTLYTNIFSFLSHKWYFNLLQNYFVSYAVLKLGYSSFWVWDRWILEQVRLKDL